MIKPIHHESRLSWEADSQNDLFYCLVFLGRMKVIQPIRIDRFFSFYIPTLSTDMHADPSQVYPFVRFFSVSVSKVSNQILKGNGTDTVFLLRGCCISIFEQAEPEEAKECLEKKVFRLR